MPVPGYTPPERLEDQQYVVLLIRLLVNRDGRIVHGDAGVPETNDSKVDRWVHFRGPDGLLGALEAWLAARPDSQDTIEGANPKAALSVSTADYEPTQRGTDHEAHQMDRLATRWPLTPTERWDGAGGPV